MSQSALWEINALPFVWGAQHEPHNQSGLPDELPFSLAVDMRSGLVIQNPNDVVATALSKAYEIGSVLGSNVDEDGIGRNYADDFLSFILNSLRTHRVKTDSVLEIGCGNGYLLSRLQGVFKRVIGVEPGPQGQLGARRFGVEIVQDFFPSPLISDRFSAIVLTSVLEHVQDPVALASSLTEYLDPDGRIFVSVPNEKSYIDNADVSTLFHEHWSYFEEKTLRATMELAGLTVESLHPSGFGGSLYASLTTNPSGMKLSAEDVKNSIEAARRYCERARLNCEFLGEKCTQFMSAGKTLGIYVPARFINAMRINGLSPDQIRFFDDDPGLTGSYYPGIPVSIEGRASLFDEPVDMVLIMSRTFGKDLAKKLRPTLPRTTEIKLISDLID